MTTLSTTSNRHWRTKLPPLTGRLVTLREPIAADVAALVDVLSVEDAMPFGVDTPLTDVAVHHLIDRARQQRARGAAFTFVVVSRSRTVVGLIHVRQLDSAFEVGEWECTIRPSARGRGIFLEAARMTASFAFSVVGARRLESRVPLQNGRGNTALRKLGATQEGILRRSARRRGEYVDQVLWAVLKDEWVDSCQPSSAQVH